MSAGAFFLGLLLAIMGRRRRSPAERERPRELPPILPPARGENASTTPPWPSVTPSGLPPFPGPGWQYDEPPPIAVQQRARALVTQLWARGKGAHRIEQTGGRWIAYRAEILRSGKQGVVAYRERVAAPSTPDRGTARRTVPPATGVPAALPMGAIAIPVATDPSAPNVYVMRVGMTYRVQAEAEPPPGVDPQAIMRGLELGGAKNILVTQSGPLGVVLVYDIAPTFTMPVAIGEWLTLPGNTGARLRFIEVKPLTPAVSPISMPTLRRGATGDNVRTLQRKLGIAADGKFGPGTHAAVVAHQRKHGLTPDGIVGPNTWITLLGKAA